MERRGEKRRFVESRYRRVGGGGGQATLSPRGCSHLSTYVGVSAPGFVWGFEQVR
jgi:hypothetical protein